MRKIILAILLFVSFGAMADQTMSGVVRCQGVQCEIGWIRAAQWVTQHSKYKIRLANDYLIDTFSATGINTHPLSFRVQKIEYQGSPGIELVTRCYEEWLFPCKIDMQSYIDDFLKFVPSGSTALSGPANENPVLGVDLAPLTDIIAKALHQETAHGAIVVLVKPGSVAERIGIQIGDVILTHGDNEIKVPANLTAAVRGAQRGAPIKISLLRAGQSISIDVTY